MSRRVGWRARLGGRSAGWVLALGVAAVAFTYGAFDEGPPRTNADRARALAQNYACPVCAGQSVAESDVPVAREIRRQIAVWVDEGRDDLYIRDQLVAAYDADIDYTPSATGITSLVWVLPVVAVAGIGAVLVVMLRPARASGEGPAVAAGRSSAGSAVPGRRRGRWRGVLVWTVGITVVAALAGVGVARFSGSRGAGESVTGDIRATTRQLIFDAQGALSGGDIDEAIALYDEALELQPSNVEALTYRGWLASRRGGDPDSEAAVGFIDDAIAIDPNYADARLFKAIISIENDDPARAAAELAAFDALDPPAFAETLIAQSGLRERIAEGLALAAGDSGVEPTAPSEAERSFLEVWQNPDRGSFAESGLNVADAVEASEAMAARGELLAAVQALDWVLVDLPDNPDVLAARGWLIARTGDPELVARAISYFDDALAINPQHPQALVYRAFSRSLPTTGAETGATDLRGAREDLATFDALPEQAKPQDLQDLITDYNLRATISPNN